MLYRLGVPAIDTATWAVTCWVYGHPVLSATVYALVALGVAAFVIALSTVGGVLEAAMIPILLVGSALSWWGNHRNVVRHLRGDGPGW